MLLLQRSTPSPLWPRPAPGGPAPPRWPRPRSSLRRRRRERAAREAAPLRDAAGKGGRAGAGAPGRKRAGCAGAAADMCKMSFKVSVASSGRECRAGRQSCGGEPAPGDLPGSPSPRLTGRSERRPGCWRGTGGSDLAGMAPVVCGFGCVGSASKAFGT